MFCVIDHNGVATIVSNSERGAKNYATRHGFFRVGKVSKYSMTVYDIKIKQGKRWKDEN
jgi:hypothetical protein